MKIAILGAGVSGLSCAFRLEQLGFNGEIDIYEERGDIGVGNIWIEYVAELMHRPIENMVSYLATRYQLYLLPLNAITSSINFGPTKMAEARGNLGITFARGNHPHALEKQIADKVTANIFFNSTVTLRELQRSYDVVVLATGNLHDVPEEIGVRVDRYVHFYHASIEGDFDPQQVKMWLNHDYAPKGYAYLIPVDHRQAMVSVASPLLDTDYKQGWQRFEKEVLGEQITYLDFHEIVHSTIGEPRFRQYKNIFLIGNAAGAITPAMGFGLFPAILTGIYAAESIVHNVDYDSFLRQHIKEYQWSLAIRNSLEKLTNAQYDQLVEGLDSFLGKYLIKAGRVNFMRTAGWLLKGLSREKENSYPVQEHIKEFTGATIEEKISEAEQKDQI